MSIQLKIMLTGLLLFLLSSTTIVAIKKDQPMIVALPLVFIWFTGVAMIIIGAFALIWR